MEDEVDGRILFEALNNLFLKDPHIETLGLILSTKPEEVGCEREYALNTISEAKIANAFFLRNHKLGISHWCIPTLFSYAKKQLFELILSREKQERVLIVENNVDLALALTRCVLLINAEYAVAWNIRKELIQMGELTPYQELTFLNVVFSKHHKSLEAWGHRKWTLTRLDVITKELYRSEIRIYERVAEMYPKNYLAWSQRRYLVGRSQFSEIVDDIAAIKRWIAHHVSDNSAQHHLRYLTSTLICRIHPQLRPLQNLEVTSDAKKNLVLRFLATAPSDPNFIIGETEVKHILNELKENAIMLNDFPGHESLWYHRRFLFRLLQQLLGATLKRDDDYKRIPRHKSNLSIMENEYNICFDSIISSERASYEAHSTHASSYGLYISLSLWQLYNESREKSIEDPGTREIGKQIERWKQEFSHEYLDRCTGKEGMKLNLLKP